MKNEKNEKVTAEELKKIILEELNRMEKEELKKRRRIARELRKPLSETKQIITKEDFEKVKKKVDICERKNVKENLSFNEQREEVEQFAKKNNYNIKDYLHEVVYTNSETKKLAEREQVKKIIDRFVNEQKREKANEARSKAMKELWQNDFYRQETIRKMRMARELKRKGNPPKNQGKEEK